MKFLSPFSPLLTPTLLTRPLVLSLAVMLVAVAAGAELTDGQREALKKAGQLQNTLLVPGNPAPQFKATTLDGQPFNLAGLRGKVVLLDFWATWCGPCIKEMPNVVRLWNAHRQNGLEIIGVSLDGQAGQPAPLGKVKQFAAENGMTWMHIVEGQGWGSSIGKLYGVHAIPFTCLVDSQGKIIATKLRGQPLANAVAQALGAKEIQLPSSVVQEKTSAANPSPAPAAQTRVTVIQSSRLDPTMPANITNHQRNILEIGLRQLAQGNRQNARKFFAGAMLPNPCKVLLVMTAVPNQQQQEYRVAVQAGTRLWNQAFQNEISFEEGTEPQKCPVQIFFVPTITTQNRQKRTNQYIAGSTKVDFVNDGDRARLRATVIVAINVNSTQLVSTPQSVLHVVAHELGHVIGVGELPDVKHIMGPTSANPSVALSSEDIRAVRALLEYQSQLLARAEKR